MGKTVNKVVRNVVGATVDVATAGLTTDKGRKVAGDILQTAGLATPDSLKRQQRAAEDAARQSAAAAQLAAENLQKNSMVDLSDDSNTPDVVAGGTAQQLALGGDFKKKRSTAISTQLGVKV